MSSSPGTVLRLLVLTVVVSIAGCGDSKPAATPTPAAAAPATPPDAATDPKLFFKNGDRRQRPEFEALARRLATNPDGFFGRGRPEAIRRQLANP